MIKKIVQDVVPPEQKTIRNIPIPSRRTRARASVSSTATPTPPSSFETPRVESLSRRYDTSSLVTPPRRHGPSKKGFWSIVVACVLLLVYGISFLFVSAEVTITPKTETANINAALVAKKSADEGVLGYDLVTVSKELGKTVPAQGEESVEKKASGKIVIYNKNSATSQRLIANTRFQTPGGLIYRITDAVVVPGYTKKGSDITPGSISVTVYADKPGETYNIGFSDFTIPGFKGDPRYTTVYARSETPMQGGFVGKAKKVTDSTLEATEDELEAQLKEQLMIEATSQIPDSYILYPGAVSYVFETMPQTETTDTTVKINKKGTLTGMIIDKKSLYAALSEERPIKTHDGEVYVAHPENLEFSLGASETLTPATVKDVSFTLRGPAKFVWVFDEQKVKKDLAGKPKSSLSSILSSYSSLEKARAVVSPIWKRSFPKDTDKITIRTIGVD